MTTCESVSKGLEGALAFADGNMTAAKVHPLSMSMWPKFAKELVSHRLNSPAA